MTETASSIPVRSFTIAQNNTKPTDGKPEKTEGGADSNPEPGQMVDPGVDAVPEEAPTPALQEPDMGFDVPGVKSDMQPAARSATRSSVQVAGGAGVIIDYDPEKKLAYVLTTQDVVDRGAKDDTISVKTPNGDLKIAKVLATSDNFDRAHVFIGSNLALVAVTTEEPPHVARINTAAPNRGEEVLLAGFPNIPNSDTLSPTNIGSNVSLRFAKVQRNFSPSNLEPMKNAIGNANLVIDRRLESRGEGGPVFDENGQLVAIAMDLLDATEVPMHTYQRRDGSTVEFESLGTLAISGAYILEFLRGLGLPSYSD